MATDALRARGPRENEKARMLRALEKRARAERRWAALSLWIGVAIVGLLTLAALLAPVLFPGGPNDQDMLNTLQPRAGRTRSAPTTSAATCFRAVSMARSSR